MFRPVGDRREIRPATDLSVIRHRVSVRDPTQDGRELSPSRRGHWPSPSHPCDAPLPPASSGRARNPTATELNRTEQLEFAAELVPRKSKRL